MSALEVLAGHRRRGSVLDGPGARLLPLRSMPHSTTPPASPSVTSATSPAGSLTAGWVMTCGLCGLRGITEVLTLGEADVLCRAHDQVHHGGARTAQAVEVEVCGGVR